MKDYNKELLMGKVPETSKEAGDTFQNSEDNVNPLNYIAPDKPKKERPEFKTKVFWSEQKNYIAIMVWRVGSPRQGFVRIMDPLKLENKYEPKDKDYRDLRQLISDFCIKSTIDPKFLLA